MKKYVCVGELPAVCEPEPAGSAGEQDPGGNEPRDSGQVRTLFLFPF
jgi:hypothetical protein